MKKIFFIAATLIAGISALAQQKTDDVVKLNADKYDFGKVKQDTTGTNGVTTYFTITNISDKPVVIESATAGCHCTTPDYPKEPISPNGTAKLKVGYDRRNIGPFTRYVTIKLAGINDTKQVTINGEVLDATAWDAYTKTDDYKKAEQAKLSEKDVKKIKVKSSK